MKMPAVPPAMRFELWQDLKNLDRIFELGKNPLVSRHYLHWDKLRRLKFDGWKPEEVWMVAKFQRVGNYKLIPLTDKKQNPFRFSVPELVHESLHKIDVGAGSAIGVPEPITNPQTKDKYLIRSLMEEAITSSQLEGAATTREIAKEMIRTGRAPRDKDEQMILNNYATMLRISRLKEKELTPGLVFEIHKLVTERTLQDDCADGAGRFRRDDEFRVVGDDFGAVFHEPPPASELEGRLRMMCDFANGRTPNYFIHPVIRAIILHFWLAYDHPFVDGNGRTARALFYWCLLHKGYWLLEFISISTILRRAPAKYGLSFLYTETDDNDLTYFIIAQTRVMEKAIAELHEYIARKCQEMAELESQIRALDFFNHRQADLIRYALKHPYDHYTIEGHRNSHNIVYQTARTDMLNLCSRGVLEQKTVGKKLVFTPVKNLEQTLRKIGKKLVNA